MSIDVFDVSLSDSNHNNGIDSPGWYAAIGESVAGPYNTREKAARAFMPAVRRNGSDELVATS